MRWPRSLRFDDVCSHARFIDYHSGVEMLVARRSPLVAALEQAIPDSRHAQTIAALRCFAGSTRSRPPGSLRRDPQLAAVSAQAALGVLRNRPPPSTPQISSAGKDRSPKPAPLTPPTAGRSRAPLSPPTTRRRRPRPPPARQDPRVIEVAWRAQRRLRQRWTVLRDQRHKPAGVVVIACAQELAAFCWEAATVT